ncbi:MAG: dephospho-CoA kinase [Kiritimatiellia bacterium]
MTTKQIGLTGGIACGKSEVSRRLASAGIPVLDTDQVAHEVMRSGTEVFYRIVEHFGSGMINDQGELNRRRLGDVVFSDGQSLQELNRIVHPEVVRRLRTWLSEQTGPMAVVVIPLLMECGLENEFDGVLFVRSPEEQMKARLMNRGFTAEQAESRIRAQWPVDEKAKRADWILTNNTTLPDLYKQVDTWITNQTVPE